VSQWLEAPEKEADKTTPTPTKLQQRDANDPLVIGTLKGYDQLMNLVLDEVKEAMTGTPSTCALRRIQLTATQTTKATYDTASSASLLLVAHYWSLSRP